MGDPRKEEARRREEEDRRREDDRKRDISGGNFPSVEVGNRIMYPDSQRNLHSTPSEAISENQRTESDQSRGASGGCGQDSDRAPGGSK